MGWSCTAKVKEIEKMTLVSRLNLTWFYSIVRRLFLTQIHLIETKLTEASNLGSVGKRRGFQIRILHGFANAQSEIPFTSACIIYHRDQLVIHWTLLRSDWSLDPAEQTATKLHYFVI
jgi:hypothetical protein